MTVTAVFCTGCGKSTGDCDGSCRRDLDPPRYCPACAKRLVVQVSPMRSEARCKVHGPVT